MQNSILVSVSLALLSNAASSQETSTPRKQERAATRESLIQGYTIGSQVDKSLKLKDLTGKERTFKEFAGKVTVVDFWSVKCPVSRGWEERLKTIGKEYAAKEVTFLAINSNSDETKEEIEQYVKQTGVPYTILIDENNVVADKFRATHTPHVFVLDAKGSVKYMGAIDDDHYGKKVEKQYLRDALDALLAGKAPATTTTDAKGCTIKRVPKADGDRRDGAKPTEDPKKGDGPKKGEEPKKGDK